MSKLNNLIISVLAALKANPEDYCDIETVDSHDNIVFSNGSLMTFVKYEGLLSIVPLEDFESMISKLARELNGFMLKSGHKIACVFRKDLNTYHLLEQTERIQKNTAARLKLNVDDLIDENIDIYRRGVYNEETWFALITQPSVLDKVDIEAIKEEREKFIAPAMRNAQNIFTPLDILRAKHNAFVGKFVGTLSNKNFYTSLKVVNVLEGLNFVKRQIEPNAVGKRWTPSVVLGKSVANQIGLNNYVTPVQWNIYDNIHDMSHLFPPRLSRQLMGSHGINNLGSKEGYPPNTIQIGDYVYSSIYMDVGPNQPALFNSLFGAFNNNISSDPERGRSAMPYSVSFMLNGDGLAKFSIKKVLSQILARVPPHTNLNIAQALEQLDYFTHEKQAIVGLQISAMTWCLDGPNAPKILRERKTFLKSTMETWGQLTTKENTGDNIMLWRSNILGMSQDHVGTVSAAPLPRALALLPLTRPATPFDNGTILNKTLDGKIMQLEKFSSKMNTWVTIITGTPGSGKSVMLNNLLFETCLMAGLSRLPWITIVDKGISSTGFIDLLRDRLPPEMQHLVVARRLRKSKSHSINPFDIKVGLTKPLETERSAIITFLSTLLTPSENNEPYEGTTSFCGTVVDKAFESIQDMGATSTPKMYKPHYSEELDRILQEYKVLNYQTTRRKDEYDRWVEEYDYEVYEPISLFSLVRKLHVLGEKSYSKLDKLRFWRGRDLAHRYAMPVLTDLISIIDSNEIRTVYTNSVPTGETMPTFALRQIKGIVANYECFCNYTEFDVDTARIVSLDLQDVIDDRNRQQTALFFQVARMIGVKKISLSEDDVKEDKIPALFMNYYQNMLKELNTDRKTLAFDELHNAKSDLTTMKQLEKDCREGRKWGLELILASQYMTDFGYKGQTDIETVDLLGFATNICVCSEPTDKNLETFKENISSNPAIIGEFDKIGLSAHGLTYLSYFNTKEGKYCTYMTSQVGNKKIWSLTTDQKDRSLRAAMFKLTPDRKKAIGALAYVYGSGAAKLINERAQSVKTDKEVENLVEHMARDALYRYEKEVV